MRHTPARRLFARAARRLPQQTHEALMMSQQDTFTFSMMRAALLSCRQARGRDDMSPIDAYRYRRWFA